MKEDLLTEISDWVNDQSSPTIYLLIGPRESEASAAAHAVARQFDDIRRLGSSYCLNRTRRTQRKTNLFSTIARDLADHDPEFMACLGDMVKRRAKGSSPHIPTQFNFILSPAQQLTSFGPVLVVIDALDACDENSRADVLSVLKENAQNLPPSFKVLITCLPETDVAIALRDGAHVLPKELDTVVIKQLGDRGVTAGRTKPHPSTPPIQTTWSRPDYFSLSRSASSVSDTSSSSPSSIAPSIFDGELRTFSPDLEMSSPASSVAPYIDAGSPKRFVTTFKRIHTKEESYSLDPDGQPIVTLTSTTKTIKKHANSTPRCAPFNPMLVEPNSRLITVDSTTTPAEDTLGVIPRCESPRPQKIVPLIRQENFIQSEIQTAESQPIALLSS